MTALVEQLFVAVTGLIAVDAQGMFVMRPYSDDVERDQTTDDLMLAAFLIDRAIGFVADHEFVHAVNGHTLQVAESGRFELCGVAESDVYRAFELEADRSALYCLVDDLFEGRSATNDLIDQLDITSRAALIGLAVGVLCAVWLAAQDEDGTSAFHPAARTRVYMLLGPSLVGALVRAGLPDELIARVQRILGRLLSDLGSRSRRLAPLAPIFTAAQADVHQRENARLEAVYRTIAAPLLASLQFAPLRGRS